ncbi:MAG TPA: response regulator transcription factor [Chryseolinea sp.]|nr:response regulator transcription factor [Chryseolinea sp.]
MPARILIAEDDDNMRFMLQDNLEMAGYRVCAVGDGQTCLSVFLKEEFDLCLLDVMLPRKDGFTLAADIRKINKDIPVVFLTAKLLKEDRIQGFRIGADDYVTKPFSIEELILRIEVILKRVYHTPTRADSASTYDLAGSFFNYHDQTVSSSTGTIVLTSKEAKLLRLFCIHRNQVIERDLIQKAIWEDEGYFVGRSMDVFISRLRKIFRHDPCISFQTIHGIGYKLYVKEKPVHS